MDILESSVQPSLTPEIATEYLRELSADIREALVLSADGALLAGPEPLAPAAREILRAVPDAAAIEVREGESAVFAARSARFAIVLVCGRFALPALVHFDLRTVLADLEGERPPGRAAA